MSNDIAASTSSRDETRHLQRTWLTRGTAVAVRFPTVKRSLAIFIDYSLLSLNRDWRKSGRSCLRAPTRIKSQATDMLASLRLRSLGYFDYQVYKYYAMNQFSISP
jgi:hypothetical protein